MTESEAIKELRQSIDLPFGSNVSDEAANLAIQALEEVQQYHAIGTVEEFRRAKGKQEPKKPNKTVDSSWGVKKEVHTCPACDYYLTEVHFITPQKLESNKKITYCEICGQAIDRSGEE